MLIAFSGPLWLWQGKGAWHFITLPEAESRLIRLAVPRRGWGSVRVKASIGSTTWMTSIFPDMRRNVLLLPVKAEVRNATALAAGDTAQVLLSLDW